MGTENISPKLPVIDFSSVNKPLTKGNADRWGSTRDKVLRALKEYGCFEAIYENEVSCEIYPVLAEIFDLPMETKLKYTFPNFVYMDGYDKPRPLSPLRESIGIRDPHTLHQVETFTGLLWPLQNQHVCETLHSYSKQLVEMDKMVKTMVFEHFGVEKYLDAHMKSTAYSLRCTKYAKPQDEESHLSLSKHVDPGVLTILQQNDVNGLQMQTRDGVLFDVVASSNSPSSFIVLAGYALMAWSNGKIHAPLHQVVMKGDKVRYSVGMFTFLDDIVKTPEEMLDEQSEPLFKPFNNLQAMLSFLRSNHQKELELGIGNQLTSA